MRRAETFSKRTAPIVLGLLVFCSSSVRAQTASRQFTIPSVTVTAPPKIDGTLDDPAWKSAAHVQLQWDISFQRPATEATDAYLLADKHYLYVAFVATQKEPIIATQHTNDQPMPNDDVVRVYFWPGGDSGIEYGFVSNPIGTRYELSSENTSFSPAWVAVAKTRNDGYVVTERIPLNVMRGDGRSTWRVQFDRRVRAANQTFEWAHDPAQSGTDSSLYAGYLQGMTVASQGTRTKPRIGIYALGQYASAASGGSTSRLGADLSVPLTQTSSFVATFHPDYSNVELDQQSISPTAFPRRFNEVRPFFTQGQNYYNSFNCNDCIDYPLLYTPAIPTPRSGFAVEGKQGQLTFGAFDALGISRNDAAQSLYWVSKNRKYQAVYQRVAVDMPGIHDVAEWYQGIAGNAHNFSVYATLGGERGSLITHARNGRYAEYGVNLYTPKSGLFAAYHDNILEIPETVQHFLRPGEDHDEKTTLEGGDVMMVSPQHLIVGCSERTSVSGANEAIKLLFENKVVKKVTIVKIPHKRDYMHIDTIFTQVKRNVWILLRSLAKTETHIDKNQPLSWFADKKNKDRPEIVQFEKGKKPATFDTIEALLTDISENDLQSKKKTKFIYSGNNAFPFDAREQWTDSCNLLALREGVVLGYDRNDKTIDAFKKHGFDVIDVKELLQKFENDEIDPQTMKDTLILMPSSELSRARGGFHCMSMPLFRDNL